VTVRSATVSVPVRGTPGLAAIVKATGPVAVPDAPLVTVIHDT
jgi:hypothetical protein